MTFKPCGFEQDIHLGVTLTPVSRNSRRATVAGAEKVRVLERLSRCLERGEISGRKPNQKGNQLSRCLDIRERDIVKKDNIAEVEEDKRKQDENKQSRRGKKEKKEENEGKQKAKISKARHLYCSFLTVLSISFIVRTCPRPRQVWPRADFFFCQPLDLLDI